MRRHLAIIATCIATFGLLLGLNAVTGSASTPAAKPKVATIVISNFTYTGTLTVHAGVRVRVENHDTTSHTATNPGGHFNTGTITPGGFKTFTAPSTVGTYLLRCMFHSFMKGKLHVIAP
jgi:plastocyanin